MPVIGFRAGGLAEAVTHEETGLLVSPEDVDGLAAAIESLLTDADARERLGNAGRERMRAEFAVDTMADRHVALYEAILGGG